MLPHMYYWTSFCNHLWIKTSLEQRPLPISTPAAFSVSSGLRNKTTLQLRPLSNSPMGGPSSEVPL